MTDISELFLYLPGIVVFLAESGRARRLLHGACLQAGVLRCDHVVKKDKKGRETYNYYNVLVEYASPKTGHRERRSVKSPTEYAKAQQVFIYLNQGRGEPVLAEAEEEALIHPLAAMAGGALLILLALFHNRGDKAMAMLCLAAVLAGAGAGMAWKAIRAKRAGLVEIDAEVTDIYTRQISKETKILKSEKFTYYPVVRYQLDGRECIRRCNVNSERKQAFETGSRFRLYYDKKTGRTYEKKAGPAVAAAGAVLLLLGLLAGASAVSVLLMQ